MASKFLQASKFRNVLGTPFKREEWYVDLNTSTSASADVQQMLAVSAKHIAVLWNSAGNGTVGVFPLSAIGKRTREIPLLQAHSSTLYDMQFSRFDDDLLATTGDDATIRLWKLSDWSAPTAAEVTLSSHAKRVTVARFHPTAANVLASSSEDQTVKMFDIGTGQDRLSLSLADSATSLSWSFDGSLLAVTTKDRKQLLVTDPRANQIVLQGEGHQGVKPSRVVWLGELPLLATTGFSKTRDREFALWDTRNLSKRLFTTVVDSSTGVLVPIYDPDSKLLFLSGKGDNTVRPYEIIAENKPPSALPVVTSDVQQRDVAALPKHAVDTTETEITRLFRLSANSVVPVRFSVPRKSKAQFPADLYPLTPGTEPALQASQWFSGENKPPVLINLNPSQRSAPSSSSSSSSTSTSSSSSSSSSYSSAANSTSTPTGGSASSSLASSSNQSTSTPEYVPKEVKVVRSSKYRHIVGKGTKKEQCFENFRLDASAATPNLIKSNGTLFAVPWTGAGGRLAVLPVNRPGRLPDSPGLLECGSTLGDFDLNPFVSDIVATASEDGHVKIFKVPADLMTLKKNETNPVIDFAAHNRKVNTANFHPLASNVLVTTASDGTLKVWDVSASPSSASFTVQNAFADAVQSLSFDYNGSSVITASRDRILKFIDLRSSQVSGQVEGHQGPKGIRVTSLGNSNRFLSTGFSKGSDREFKIWDYRSLSSGPLSTTAVDIASGILVPLYDADTNVVYFVGRGDTSILYYEVVDSEAFSLSSFPSGKDPIIDVALLPKSVCNVQSVEIDRLLKLSTVNVEPVSFSVPRNRMEFFQDDVFPPTPDLSKPVLSASQWLSGKTVDPPLISLQPPGMQPLSAAPTIAKEKKYKFDPTKEEKEVDFKDAIFNRVSRLAIKEDENTVKPKTDEDFDDDDWK